MGGRSGEKCLGGAGLNSSSSSESSSATAAADCLEGIHDATRFRAFETWRSICACITFASEGFAAEAVAAATAAREVVAAIRFMLVVRAVVADLI